MSPPKTERNLAIVADKRSGKAISELMEIYGLTRRRINAIILRETQRPRRRVKKMAIYRDNRLRDAKLIREYREGLSFAEIADKNDLSKARVGSIIRQKMPDYAAVNKAKAEKEMSELVKRYKARQAPAIAPKKYSKEWTELQWKLAYERDAL